jgi:hypothetical protein
MAHALLKLSLPQDSGLVSEEGKTFPEKTSIQPWLMTTLAYEIFRPDQ